jgi:hypothetical protein
MFNAQPSNDAPITPVNGERKMGLMSRIFGGKLSANNSSGGQLANDGTNHALDKNKVLAATDSSVPSPTNADFSSIRSVPVVQAPRYFNKQEAEALRTLAKQKKVMAEASRTAYQALRNIDTSDTEVHTVHRRYQGKIARNEVSKLQANAELAKKLHGSRSAYAEMHSQVENANVNAANAINAIKQSYGG